MEFIYDDLMSEIQYVGIVLFYFAIFICNNLAKLKKYLHPFIMEKLNTYLYFFLAALVKGCTKTIGVKMMVYCTSALKYPFGICV